MIQSLICNQVFGYDIHPSDLPWLERWLGWDGADSFIRCNWEWGLDNAIGSDRRKPWQGNAAMVRAGNVPYWRVEDGRIEWLPSNPLILEWMAKGEIG